MSEKNSQRSYSELQRLAAELRERGRYNGHRYLILLPGERQYCDQMMASVNREDGADTLILSRNVEHSTALSAKYYLGQEYSSLVIDAWSELSINSWLAAAGTLRAGGILFLSCPSLDSWPRYHAEQSGSATSSLLIQRLVTVAKSSSAVVVWPQNNVAELALPTMAEAWARQLPSRDQLAAISAVKRVVTGRAKRPLVIRADRGRGKTALLGIAAAELFSEGLCKNILIIADNKSAITPALSQLEINFAGGHWHDNRYQLGDCELHIQTMAQALHGAAPWDLVLVDEAASYAVTMLRDVVLRYPRLVLATTVHGYEGSGRGFDIRFKATLDQLRPQWRRQYLEAPIRWGANDPLEAFLNRAFLLDAEVASLDADSSFASVHELSKAELCSNESRLRQVFGLLVQAHYQTTPQDLQQLLDGSSRVLVATVNEQIVAVCLLFPEGNIDRQTAEDISAGRRRPKGNMVAQGLSQLSGDSSYCEAPSLRISRIAVQAEWRRRGLGRQLIAAAEKITSQENISYLSSSFALDNDALSFWRALDFVPLALGSRIDPASGGYSLIIGKSKNACLESNFEQLQRQLQWDLPCSVRSVHRALCPTLLLALLADNTDFEHVQSDAAITDRYLSRELSYEQAAAALARFSLACALQADGAELSLRLLVYGQDWKDLASDYKLAGRAECEAILRQYVHILYEKFSRDPNHEHCIQ